MTAGDISWNGGGALGYASSVNRALPSGGTVSITSSAQVSAFVAAVQSSNKRIVIDPGVTLILPNQQLVVGSNVQVICLSGRATLDCRAFGTGTQFFLHANTIFANIWFQKALGDVNAGNNPAGLFEFASTDSDLLYMVGCTIEQPDDVGAYPHDGPEGLNSWDNTGNGSGPQRFTLHSCRWIVAGGVTKAIIMGGFNELSRLRGTMYRCVSYTKFRSPMTKGSAWCDVVNCVWPTTDRDASVEVDTGGRVNIRGGMFGTSGPVTNHGSGVAPQIYAPALGQGGNDGNFLQSPPVALSATSSTPVFATPYTLVPDVASQALMDQLVADAGAGGVIVISIEGSSPTYVNPPQGAAGFRHLVKGIGR